DEYHIIFKKMILAELANSVYINWVCKAVPSNLRPLQGISADDPYGWMFLGERNHFFQAFGKDPIVSENNLAICAPRRNVTQCNVVVLQGTQESLVLSDADTWLFLRKSTRDLRGAIRAAVVNDSVIPVDVGLSKNTFNAFLKMIRVVIHRGYNGHQRTRRTHSFGQF